MPSGRQILIGICLLFVTLSPGIPFPLTVEAQETQSPASNAPAPASTSAGATPLTAPAITGPLTASTPIMFDAGPFGKLALDGIVSGFGAWQSNPVSSDQAALADVSNGQIFLQKPTGVVQFYVQAGAYNLPALGAPFLSTANTISGFYGPLPQAYVKIAPKGPFSFQAGKLPTLIGAEYTFTFENVNIERGLLWNQENAVNRGVQLNYTEKKLAASLSWNDGFYSNRWNWLWGSATYTFNTANNVIFVAGGNLGNTNYSTIATPAAQNNSSIYNVIYTHTAKNWTLQPYFQFTHISEHPMIGIYRTTSTQGEALLGFYSLPHHMSLGGRVEYISSTGNANQGSANLLYGPGSNAVSLTLTPTYQRGTFFARGELSYVHAGSTTPGDSFGHNGMDTSQVRGLLEAGFLF